MSLVPDHLITFEVIGLRLVIFRSMDLFVSRRLQLVIVT